MQKDNVKSTVRKAIEAIQSDLETLSPTQAAFVGAAIAAAQGEKEKNQIAEMRYLHERHDRKEHNAVQTEIFDALKADLEASGLPKEAANKALSVVVDASPRVKLFSERESGAKGR